MARSFSIGPAQIVALFMTCIFYGILLVTTGHCLNVLLLKKTGKTGAHRLALVVTIYMFAVASNDTALCLVHVLDAFAYYTGPGGAEGELSHVSSWINVVKLVNYLLQTTVGDLILIYRCFIIFNRRWPIIVLPVILWLGFVVPNALAIYVTAYRHNLGSISSDQTPFITVSIAATLAQNTLTTGMIVFKLWSHGRETRDLCWRNTFQSRVSRLIGIIVESALLYTVFTFLTLVTFLLNNNADYALSDCVVQTIGIAFNMIIIRGHGTLSQVNVDFTQDTLSSLRTNQFRMSTMPARLDGIDRSKVSEIPDWPVASDVSVGK